MKWDGVERASKQQVRQMWIDFIVGKIQEYSCGEGDKGITEIATEIADEFVEVMQTAAERLTGKKLPP